MCRTLRATRSDAQGTQPLRHVPRAGERHSEEEYGDDGLLDRIEVPAMAACAVFSMNVSSRSALR